MNPKKAKDDDAEALALELLQAKEELAKLKDLAARSQADLQNAKDRLQKEAGDIRKFALEGTILSLLPTIDNFQRAIAHLPKEISDHDWVKGISATEQELMKKLAQMGLKRMECIGEQGNPARHEVLQQGPGEEGIVTEVFEDGYELHGKVIRPAKVKVGHGS